MGDKIELNDLLGMSRKQVAEVFWKGHPIDTGKLDHTQYLGIDLGMPAWFHKYFWKTFRKTFYRDPSTGVLRGWNVRLEQTGWQGETIPMKNKKGDELAFGHYHVLSAEGRRFPKGWKGSHYLDYGVAGNSAMDMARLGYCPLVAVNEGSTELLLGWEVFKAGPAFIPLPDHWVLKYDGPLRVVQDPPAKRKG
jgi:hypothetical protein